jgi:hypothetical protein
MQSVVGVVQLLPATPPGNGGLVTDLLVLALLSLGPGDRGAKEI